MKSVQNHIIYIDNNNIRINYYLDISKYFTNIRFKLNNVYITAIPNISARPRAF